MLMGIMKGKIMMTMMTMMVVAERVAMICCGATLRTLFFFFWCNFTGSCVCRRHFASTIMEVLLNLSLATSIHFKSLFF